MKYLKILLTGALLMPQQLNAADKLIIHYNRLDRAYAGWNLWVWNDGEKRPGFELAPAGDGPFGIFFELDLDASGLSGKRADKDAPDRIMERARQGEVYLMEGDGKVYDAPPAVSTAVTGAWYDGGSAVRAAFTRPLDAAYLAAQEQGPLCRAVHELFAVGRVCKRVHEDGNVVLRRHLVPGVVRHHAGVTEHVGNRVL